MDKNHHVEELLGNTIDTLKGLLGSNTLIGAPIEANGVTLIPVSKLSVAVGGGGSDYISKHKKQEESNTFGGGTAASVKIEPIAFLVLKEGNVKMLHVSLLDASGLTVFIFRGQRDEDGNRTMKQWPTNVGRHAGLRALMLGSNDLRVVEDSPSFLISILDIADNPNISIDVTSICAYWEAGYFALYYDKTQDIRGCTSLGITK